MKRFINSISRISDYVSSHAWTRALFYAVVILSLVLIYVNLESAEVSFVYNEF